MSEEKVKEEKEILPETHEGEKVRRFSFSKKYIIILLAALILFYFAGVIYYSSHFLPDTYINNVACANLTIDEARQKISKVVDGYTYTIKTGDGKNEIIKGSDIDLQCSRIDGVDTAKEKQNPFLWLIDRKNRKLNAKPEITYDEDKLFYIMEWLDCMVRSRETLETITSRVVYENGTYHVSGDDGKKIIDFGKFFSTARLDIYDLKNEISLEEAGLYIPESETEKAQPALKRMNELVSSNITYQRGEQSYVVNGDVISQWVSIGSDYSVYLDAPKIKEYVKELASCYDTVGGERNFITSKGETITVGGGNYGWKINQDAEIKTLTDLILTGQTIVKEPAYIRTAAVHGNGCDIYNTYVEISLASQHLWFYKNGELIVESPVVTGNTAAGNSTPPGVFYLNYKTRNAILRGADYETPVSYWMPFNGGIGLHDATWRGAFGGSIYRGGGSHGCVNLPFNVAKTIYQSISSGDPVVVY